MICYYCNTDQTDFYRSTGKKPKCRACHSAYISAYLKSRPEKTAKNRSYAKKSRPRRLTLRRQFIYWIKLQPCMDCNQIYHPEVMEFDHVGDKTDNISIMVARKMAEETIWQEILRCELVCANCHRARTVIRRLGIDEYNKHLVGRSGTAPASSP